MHAITLSEQGGGTDHSTAALTTGSTSHVYVCVTAGYMMPRPAELRIGHSASRLIVAVTVRRLYLQRQQLNERIFELLQPPPPQISEYPDDLREARAVW